ncbi:uncharacterized protein L201_003652 [Kwoniella dendrophila CBS 6074]|uniref:Guanosine-3',5'-bis(diphosphate) 3'-pyrophosphohydrolase MESH1 n=1 Tax=Kwoniella dendrophila CBS 6074 TaxID=1295534 RepID=A0AAX4JTS6_9TREE
MPSSTTATSSSSSLQLDLPPIPQRIIQTSPSPSSSTSTTTTNPISNGHKPNDNDSLDPNQNSNCSFLMDKLKNTKTPSELDLSKTPPPRSFAPSPPLLITRNSSDIDLLSLNENDIENDIDNENENGNGSNDRINGNSSKSKLKSKSKSTINGSKSGSSSRHKYKDENDLSKLMRTVDFAARKHSCQRRKDVDQTPYINHPIAVANYLSSTGITDVKVLQAAVLHDTVEDTHTTIEEIAQSFGTDVARIVEECTDDNTLSGMDRKTAQLRSAPYKSREAQQVKLADKIHNLESIRRCPPVGWGIKRIQAYFIWAKQVTDVCAPAHPPLAAKLQELYETAYTRVDGVYHPCHPGVCGPLTEPEKELIDSRLRVLKKGDKVCPAPIFF